MIISEFQDQYRFLSNFFPLPEGVMYDDQKYPTVEHAYQASKTVNEGQRRSIQSAPRPGIAKTMGRQVTVRDGWGPEMKLAVMEDLLRQKFSVDPLKTMLLQTGDAELAEGNDWGDTFWGIFKRRGENNLGKLLMKIRADIRSEEVSQLEENRVGSLELPPTDVVLNSTSPYKGFTGMYGPREGGGFFGEVTGAGKDIITFESDTQEEIQKEFETSVDDYLEMKGERSNA